MHSSQRHFLQVTPRNRLWRVVALTIAGLALVLGIIAYTRDNTNGYSVYLEEDSYVKDVPMYHDEAPSLWSQSHYPRPGKSDAGQPLKIIESKIDLNSTFDSTGYRLDREEASVVARLRNDEKLLEGIISEGKLVNQERSALKVGQTLKVDVPALHPQPVGSVSRSNDVEVCTLAYPRPETPQTAVQKHGSPHPEAEMRESVTLSL
jgi:hypothetical protein